VLQGHLKRLFIYGIVKSSELFAKLQATVIVQVYQPLNDANTQRLCNQKTGQTDRRQVVALPLSINHPGKQI